MYLVSSFQCVSGDGGCLHFFCQNDLGMYGEGQQALETYIEICFHNPSYDQVNKSYLWTFLEERRGVPQKDMNVQTWLRRRFMIDSLDVFGPNWFCLKHTLGSRLLFTIKSLRWSSFSFDPSGLYHWKHTKSGRELWQHKWEAVIWVCVHMLGAPGYSHPGLTVLFLLSV